MVKLIGDKKIKIAVFISGKGSNLENLLRHSFKKKSQFKIKLIISNNPSAEGLKFAKKYKINKKIINYNKIKESKKNILDKLNKCQIKLICLAGYMKILSDNFIKKFNGKIINIHPSLLPKYKGLNTHQRVIENRENFSGCTVHYVNKKLDSGKIILQKKVKVLTTDTIDKLKKRILKQEHLLYPKAIKKVLTNL